MNLSNEEKYRIYLEEKKRLEKEEEERKKSLFEEKQNLMSEEQKRIIYNEINENKIVYAGKDDINYPKITEKTIGWIFGLAFIFLYFFISIVGAFVIGFIAFIVLIVLQVKKVVITSPEIQYRCPVCNHRHSAFLRKEEKKEMTSSGYIKAKCHRCNEGFRLIVDESLLDIVTLK